MVLYAVLVSIIILGLIAFKGPLELAYLKSAGIDLLESFQAAARTSALDASITGGALALVLVVQPLVFGVLVLFILDRVFKYAVLSKLQSRGYLNLEQYTTGERPRSGMELKEMTSHIETYAPSVASSFGNIAAASFEDVDDLGQYQGLAERLVPFVLFRGSKAQVYVVTILLTAGIILVAFARPLLAAAAELAAGVLLFGPTMAVYLTLLSRFALDTEVKKRRIILEASGVSKELAKSRYELFRPFYRDNRIRRAAHLIRFTWNQAVSGVRARLRLSRQRHLRRMVKDRILQERVAAETRNLPSLAAALTVLAEYREGSFSLRSNPRSYWWLRRRLVRRVSRITRIF